MKARETIAHPCERSSSVDTSSSNSTEAGSRVIVIFSTRGVPRCFSVHRKRRGRVFQRHAESNFAHERSSGVPPCSIRASGRTVPRRVSRAARVDVDFLAGFARAFRASSDPGTRSSFAESRIAIFAIKPRFTDDYQTRKWKGAVQADLISYDTLGRESDGRDPARRCDRSPSQLRTRSGEVP